MHTDPSLIAAIKLDGVGAGSTVSGAFNKESFREYMEEDLLPSLKRGDIVVLDNLSVHKNSFNIRRFKRRGIEVKYPPRYSPGLNPIENMWGKVKASIRKIEPRTEEEIWHATNEALCAVSNSNIAGWIRGCGYLH